MRIHTRIVLDWDGHVLEDESFEYSGPLELCDRKTSQQIANQGISNSKQNQTNAQSSLGSANAALTQYSDNLNNFMKFGRKTYGANGEYMRDANTLANTTAAAGTKAISGNLALDKMRTGANDANFASTAAESQRQGEQTLTNQLATADQTRLANLTSINQSGVQMSAVPAQIQSQLYGTSLGGANSALSTAAGASAAAPSFADTLPGDLTAAIGAAGQVGAGFAKAGAGCWIAAELYGGWFEPRTVKVRAWLFGPFKKTWYGRLVTALYLRFGEATAGAIRRHPLLRPPFQWLFDQALRKAEGR